MKQIVAAIAITLVSGTASAQWHRGHVDYYRYEHRSNWVAPLVIGGIAATVVLRNQPVIVEQQPAYVEQQPIYVGQTQSCSEWREVNRRDGSVVRERVCYTNPNTRGSTSWQQD